MRTIRTTLQALVALLLTTNKSNRVVVAQSQDTSSNPLEVLGEFLENLTAPTPAKYRSDQNYTLIFRLDGPSGNGLIGTPAQVNEFTGFMENITLSFAPEYASLEDLKNVTTKCRYRKQNSFDGDVSVSVDMDNKRAALTGKGRHYSGRSLATTRQDEDDLEEVLDPILELILFANTSYEYIFSMSYTSNVINVENFTDHFKEQVFRHEPLLQAKLRQILNVPEERTLTIQGLFEYDLAAEMAAELAEELAEAEDAGFDINITVVNGTTLTTDLPSISAQPSVQPSVSETPTVSPSPTTMPSFMTNSSSRGKFELSFHVTGTQDPKSLEIPGDVVCDAMKAFTPSIAPPEHDPEQVETACPLPIVGKVSIPTIPVPLSPTTAPSVLATDENDEGDLDVSEELDAIDVPVLPTTEENATGTVPPDGRRTLFLRSRNLQIFGNNTTGNSNSTESPSASPSMPTSPTVAPVPFTVLWRYTIVLTYTSAYWDVSTYPILLQRYLTDNADILKDEFFAQNNLTESSVTDISFLLFEDETEAPSGAPTQIPSEFPSEYTTFEPTLTPSDAPSRNGTIPGVTGTPISPPSNNTNNPGTPATKAPSREKPIEPGSSKDDTGLIIGVVVAVILVASAMMFGLLRFYRKRRAKLESYKSSFQRNQPDDSVIARPSDTHFDEHARMSALANMSPSIRSDLSPLHEHSISTASAISAIDNSGQPHHSKHMSNGSASLGSAVSDGVTSQSSLSTSSRSPTGPQRSMLSDIEENPSSADLAGGGDADDDDDDSVMRNAIAANATNPVVDPFAQYTDQNLEKMRTNVEGNVSGLDGMMSQAMTLALMDDAVPSPTDSSPWQGAESGVEIEVNVLWEVTEWLRRHYGVTEDQKQVYMQELLTKMVTSVRKGFVDPEVASRSIHECAHLLGLELANELPSETLLLTGMQKTTTAQDVLKTFLAFGPVDEVAVASNQKGFGLVRFRNPRNITAAMQQCKMSEVVVKDVAITLRRL